MNPELIIQTLKDQYPRDVRKQLVNAILQSEKANDIMLMQQHYHLMNQIFSYVLKECNWSMPDNSTQWDNTPLEIMSKAFPKLNTTDWYKEQAVIVSNQSIDVVMDKMDKKE